MIQSTEARAKFTERRPDRRLELRVAKKRDARAMRVRLEEGPGDYLLSRVSNIIGGARLTTVFGMGTGMAKHLSSPGIRGARQPLGRTLWRHAPLDEVNR